MGGRGGEPSSIPGGAKPLRFEWDPAKSASNKVKHGIDFEEAKAIWQDLDRAVLRSKHEGEPRQLTIAPLNGRMYTAIITMRGDSVRVISVRRSWKREEAAYYAGQGVDRQ
jgi:uncharacterized DUF497 family protein